MPLKHTTNGEHERVLQHLLQGVREPLFLIDTDGTIAFANDAVACVLDKPGADLTGKNIFDLLPPEVASVRRKWVAEILLSGRPGQFEDTHHNRCFLSSVYPLVNAGGKVEKLMVLAHDITEAREAELAVAWNQQILNTLINATAGAMFLIVPDGEILVANQTTAKRFGLTTTSIKGKNIFDLLPPPVAAHRKAFARKVISTRQPVRFQDQHDSSFYDTAGYPLFDENGNVAKIAIFSTNITEQKKAERALMQGEQALRAVLNATTEGIFLMTAEGEILIANGTLARIYGGDTQALTGKNIYALLPPAIAERRRAIAATVIETGQPVRFEDVNGGRFADISIYPIPDETGRVTKLAVFGKDITDQKSAEAHLRESEEKYRLLVEHSPYCIGIHIEGTIVFVNSAGARMLGARSPSELIGRPALEVVHPSFRERSIYNIKQLLERGAPIVLWQETWQRLDGGILEVELSSFIFPYQGQSAIYVVAEDITQRLRNEQQLRNSAQQLKALSQQLVQIQENERRHIARELHDQVGQSLTAIQLTLQQALDTPSHSSPNEALQTSIALVGELIQQTQDLSLSLRPSLLDDLGLEAALRWLVNRHKSLSTFALEFWADPLERRLDPRIEIACFRIAQEALTNIIRHAQATNATIHLRVSGTQLHLAIHDDGNGFNPSAMKRWGGNRTGLGLAGMQERATLAGGELEIRSSAQRGTEIHARFPLKWLIPDQPK